MTHQLTTVWLDDQPQAWVNAGFDVTDGVVTIGRTAIVLGADPEPTRGIRAIALDGIEGTVDGIDVRSDEPRPSNDTPHPNGVSHLDHLVLFSPDVERSTDALVDAGLEVRRTRTGDDGRRQVFFWLGDVILELIGPVAADPEPGPSILWGLALSCDDLDAAADLLGDALGQIKPAIQDGRRIATLRTKDLGISTAIAFMTPHVPTSGD